MSKEIPLSNEKLNYLVNKYKTPLQLYDANGIIKNTKKLIDTFKIQFNEFKQFFAVKALPNPSILKLLINLGCGLDCSSVSELYIAQKLGVDGSNIIYTSNYTSDEDLKIAIDQNVIINLDDISLIKSLIKINKKCTETICFRLNPGIGNTGSNTKSNILGGPDAKFGIPPSQIIEAYKIAKDNGCKKFGIHMMTGSCVMNNDYWINSLTILINTIKKISKELNIKFDFINVGGGLGIPYKPKDKVIDIIDLSIKMKNLFKSNFNNEPKLFMENGRYITGPYGWLISRCRAIKYTSSVYYGLDACMANLMRPGMYGSYHHITIPTCKSKIKNYSNVVGTLCENNDWFAKNRLLPDAEVNDIFVIHDTGAHSHSMGFQYNGKLRAPEVLLYNGNDYLIREREKIKCLYDNTIIPKFLS